MKKKYWVIPLCIISTLVIGFATIPLSLLLKVKENPKELKKKYRLNDIQEIKRNSFTPLNQVAYPDSKLKERTLQQDYKDSILSFTYQFTSKMDSFSYSPLNLYAAYDSLSYGSDKKELQEKWNSLLGLNQETREQEFKKLYEADYYLNDQGTLQLYQGLFLSNQYQVNPDVLKKMTERYSEAYSLDFSSEKDIQSMLSWIDNKLGEKNFIEKKDLELDSETSAYLFNTLYFQGKWKTKYRKDKTYTSAFYPKGKEAKKVNFMYHTYYTKVYEYNTLKHFQIIEL